jgi:hypothetical protein
MPKIVWKYHGKKYEMEKRVWHGMRARCHNPKNQAYPRYGGRGIFMCDEWRDNFDCFYEDMGPKPHGFDLDRIDNNKGYSKENCQWVTRKENCRNTRNNIKVNIDGHEFMMHELVEKTGQKPSTIYYRLKKSMSIDAVLSKEKLPNSVRKFPPRHGTYYEYQKWGCKCEPCKAAASEYKKHRYEQRKLSKSCEAVLQ